MRRGASGVRLQPEATEDFPADRRLSARDGRNLVIPASEPLAAEAMQAWLEAGRPTGVELVWRADWPDWRPIAHVFPEHVPARSG